MIELQLQLYETSNIVSKVTLSKQNSTNTSIIHHSSRKTDISFYLSDNHLFTNFVLGEQLFIFDYGKNPFRTQPYPLKGCFSAGSIGSGQSNLIKQLATNSYTLFITIFLNKFLNNKFKEFFYENCIFEFFESVQTITHIKKNL